MVFNLILSFKNEQNLRKRNRFASWNITEKIQLIELLIF